MEDTYRISIVQQTLWAPSIYNELTNIIPSWKTPGSTEYPVPVLPPNSEAATIIGNLTIAFPEERHIEIHFPVLPPCMLDIDGDAHMGSTGEHME